MPYENKTRVNLPLTQVADGYFAEELIADKVFGGIASKHLTGIIPTYGTAHSKLISSRVFDRGKYRTVTSVERSLDTTYSIGQHGFHDIVSENDLDNVEEPFDAEADVTMGLSSLLLNEKEFEISQLLTKVDSYSASNVETLAGNDQFSNRKDSDPLSVFADLIATINNKSGKKANAAIIPWDVFRQLITNSTIISAAGTGNVQLATLAQLKNALGLDEILVPNGFYHNDSDELTSFWGKNIIVYHKPKSVMRKQVVFGYKFYLKGKENRVYKFQREPTGLNIYQDMAYSFMIREKDAGALIQNAIA